MKHFRSAATISTSVLLSSAFLATTAAAQPATNPSPAEAAPSPTEAAPTTEAPAAPAPFADAAVEPSAEASVGVTAEVPATPEPLTPEPAVEEPAAPESAEEKPALPSKLAVGKAGGGFFQPAMLFQFWTYYSRDDEDVFTFRVRRAEFKAKGEIIPELLSYNLMIDASKALLSRSSSTDVEVVDDMGTPIGTATVSTPSGDNALLQDFGLTLASDYADVTMGQFKNPVGLEGSGSSSKLILAERAPVSRQFGDRRDLGVKAEKTFGDVFYYNLGVYSGSGLNRADEDTDKDLGLRLEAYPIDGLTIGAVGYTTVGERDSFRDRIEGDVKYDANDLLVVAEYIRGWDGAGGGGATQGHGTYGALGYTIGKFQPVLRIGMLDVDVDAEDDSLMHYDLGVNYFIQGQEARVILAGTLTDPEADGVDSKTEVILAFQASF